MPCRRLASPTPLIVTNDGPPRNATCDRPLIRVRSSISSATVTEPSEADTDGPLAAGADDAAVAAAGAVTRTRTTRSASTYGSGFNRTPWTTLKMAVVAPMPSASASTATVVKTGLPPSDRQA